MNTFWQKKYIRDVGIAIGVILLPFTIYIHLLFEKYVGVLNIFSWEIHHGFNGNDVFVWYLLLMLIPVSLLSIWFLTSSYRWRYLIVFSVLIFLDDVIRAMLYIVDFNLIESYIDSLLFNIIFVDVIFSIDTYFMGNKSDVIEVDMAGVLKKDVRRDYGKIIDETSKIRNKHFSYSKNYIDRLYHIQSIVDDSLYGVYSGTFGLVVVKKYIEVFIIVFLSLTPFLFYLHHMVPIGIKEYTVLWYTITSNYFPDLYVFTWTLGLKLCILLPLCIWFVTCVHWWRYAILSPIVLFSYQIWEMFQDMRYMDALGNLRAFPAIFCVVLFLVLISRIAHYKVKLMDVYASISEEIEVLLAKTHNQSKGIQDLESKFQMLLKNEVNENNAKVHIASLTQLKNELDKIAGSRGG